MSKSEWRRPTRSARLNRQIEELQRIRGLIPTKEDILKYGLTAEEFLAIPLGPRIEGERFFKWQDAINGIMVVLRKRDAENPEVQIVYSELREAIRILIDDEPSGSVAWFVISVLESNGLIDTNNCRYVNIVRPKVEGGVPVPF